MAGSENDKPSGDDGYIRYNDDNNEFEGYGNGAWGSFGGVKNTAGTTLINATSDNKLLMKTDDINRMVINSTGKCRYWNR